MHSKIVIVPVSLLVWSSTFWEALATSCSVMRQAERLSLINNVPLKLDVISGFRWDKYGREFLLNQFNTKYKMANDFEMFNYPGGRLFRLIVREFNRKVGFRNRFYIKEENVECFDSRVLELKPRYSLYLEGYWQSEKYFKDIASQIRDDFKIISPHEPQAILEERKIKRVANPEPWASAAIQKPQRRTGTRCYPLIIMRGPLA